MTPVSFATQELHPRDQLQAWREWFAALFDLVAAEPATEEFSARNSVWDLGDISISRVLAPAIRAERGKANLSRAPMDHWVLNYSTQGTTWAQTPKGEFEAAGGVPYLLSFGEPFSCDRTCVDRVQLLMSREAFQDLAPLLDASRGAALEPRWGGLLGDYMLALERWLPSMKDSDMPRLVAAVRSMVAACIAPSAQHAVMAREEIDCGLLERVRRTVQAHLQSPQLDPAALCRTLGISRSRLYRLFERTGGVARYIQHQRLLRIGALLSDPANQRPIAAVAADFCFEDASGFSRAFREEFGCSPSDVRSAAKAGIPLIAMRRNAMEAEVTRFTDLFEDSRH